MRKVKVNVTNHLEIDNIEGFIIRRVTPFGNSARVDCPKQYLGSLPGDHMNELNREMYRTLTTTDIFVDKSFRIRTKEQDSIGFSI